MTELALGTGPTGEQKEFIEAAQYSGNSLLAVINDILDFSKIAAGKLDLEPIPFNLRECVARIMKPMAYRAAANGLELLCHVRPGVPRQIVADPTRLKQIINNLLGNAIKFTTVGEIELCVDVDAMDGAHARLHFLVRATGIGIPPEKHKLIFESFSQADASTTRRFGGTGLGLTISARLVEMMGGRIWVESKPGGGSCFHFTVQVALAAAEPTAQPAPDIGLGGLTVLIVDDNPTNRRILSELVAAEGMIPVLTEGAQGAFAEMEAAAANGTDFKLALIDGNMPEMDGFALIEELRRRQVAAGTRILMLSSAGQRDEAARCRSLGVAYLTKPVSQSQLVEAMRLALGYSESPAATEPTSPHTLPETPAALRILVAEDNPVNQVVLRRLLERQHHSVTLAANGREALEAFERQTFDLILMDIQMPELDGLQASAEIRRREQGDAHIPIMALTAHAMSGDRERCLSSGMDGYVTKPIRMADLASEINRLQALAASSPTRRG